MQAMLNGESVQDALVWDRNSGSVMGMSSVEHNEASETRSYEAETGISMVRSFQLHSLFADRSQFAPVHCEDALQMLRLGIAQLLFSFRTSSMNVELTSARHESTTAAIDSAEYPCALTAGINARKLAQMTLLCIRPMLASCLDAERQEGGTRSAQTR